MLTKANYREFEKLPDDEYAEFVADMERANNGDAEAFKRQRKNADTLIPHTALEAHIASRVGKDRLMDIEALRIGAMRFQDGITPPNPSPLETAAIERATLAYMNLFTCQLAESQNRSSNLEVSMAFAKLTADADKRLGRALSDLSKIMALQTGRRFLTLSFGGYQDQGRDMSSLEPVAENA